MGNKKSISSGLEDLFKKDGLAEQQKYAAVIANRVSRSNTETEPLLKTVPKKTTNQPLSSYLQDPSVSHTVDHTVDQSSHSVDHSINHTVDQSSHSVDHSINHTVDQSSHSVDHSVDHSVGQSGHSVDHSINHTVDQSSHSVDHSVGQSSHSVDHSINHTVDQSGHSVGHSLDQSIPNIISDKNDQSLSHSLTLFSKRWGVEHLTKNQQKVFKIIVENQHKIIKYNDISEALAIQKNTVRTVIRRLTALKLISTKRARKGILQGLLITPCIFDPTSKNIQTSEDQSLNHSPTKSFTIQSNNQATQETTLSQSHLYKKERKNLNSFFLTITENELKNQFPELKKIGFGVKQLTEIVLGLQKFGKSLDYLLQGLEHAEAAIENNLLNDMAKSEVKDPLGYIFASLRKHGTFDRPPKWVSPEERALEEASKRLEMEKNRLNLLEELEMFSDKAHFLEKFNEWKSKISNEELENIKRKLPGGGQKALEIYYRNKIYCKNGSES